MSRDWEESTEPLPGAFDERSLELGLDLSRASLSADAALASLWSEERRDEAAPDFVVFEPATRGLADRISALGYRVRVASSGVDVMTLVAARPTAAVICGPMQDGERRRLLTAALRVRFPQVPVVYVTSHAGSSEGVHGAIREGAQAVLPWPLPPDDNIHACLGGYARPAPPPPSPRPTPPSPSSQRVPEAIELPPTQVLPPRAPHPEPLSSPPPTVAVDEGYPSSLPTDPERDEWAVAKTELSGPLAAAPSATDTKTEIRALFGAIGPFVWSLNDAACWAEGLARRGDTQALAHAQTLRALGRILEQLQERVEEKRRR